MLFHAESSSPRSSDFATDVAAGFAKPQKEFLSKYLYDDVGSELFEVITLLPEYGLWRAERRLLSRHAADICRQLDRPAIVAELGSGSGKKTKWILEALSDRPVRYCPIDISPTALKRSREELREVPFVTFVGFEEEYLRGLRMVADGRGPGEQLLVLFLGSSIGNFDRPASEDLLRKMRAILQPGDALLIGTDLMKPRAVLELAYDDPIGVTAAFNLNGLARVNRELGGRFDLRNFRHQALLNLAERRIEMHLRSTVRQSAHIAALDLDVSFEAGETIWTENCHKYDLAELPELASRSGFGQTRQWVDDAWPFADSLWIAG